MITFDQLAKCGYVDVKTIEGERYDHSELLGKADVMADYNTDGELMGIELIFNETEKEFEKLKNRRYDTK